MADPRPLRAAVVLASANRAPLLDEVLADLALQTTDFVRVVSVPDAESLPASTRDWQVVTGTRGLAAQRNAGAAALEDLDPAVDVVVFFDDDAVVREDYVENALAFFAAHPGVVAITGRVLLDGSTRGEVDLEVARDAVARSAAEPLTGRWKRMRTLYGANFALRLPTPERFDEALPLYSWLEDHDIARRLMRHGTLARVDDCVIVHRAAASGGRQAHLRLGYSQVMNPVYLRRKGSFPLWLAVWELLRPVSKNVLRSLAGPEAGWRRRRLRGNLAAARDAISGRITPERITGLVESPAPDSASWSLAATEPVRPASRGGVGRRTAPLRIVLLNTLFAPFDNGGAARSVRELAVDLVRRGHEVAVHTLAPEGYEPASEELDGFTVHRFRSDASFHPFEHQGSDADAVRKALWHVRENFRAGVARSLSTSFAGFGADVVHTNNVAGFGLAAWEAADGAALVHTMRDYYLLCSRSQMFRDGALCRRQCLDCAVLKAPIRVAPRRPDLFVGVSDDIVARHRRFGVIRAHDASATVHNWPDVRPALGVEPRDDQEVRFGILGNVYQAKGIWVVVEAFLALPVDLRSRAALLVAGPASDADEARLRLLGDEEPGIRYVGQRVDPATFFADIDVALVPSQWHEPFGRVAAEARLLGVPVIASAAGGLPEAVGTFGGGELIGDFTSVPAWTDALAAAITAPPPRTPAVVPDRQPVVEQYLALYERALGRRQAR